jgi:C-terminal processing protease CtpA/Prc
MTTSTVTVPPLSIELSLKNRHSVLENVLAALRKRFYAPEKLNAEWQAAVNRHRSMIESAGSADQFELAMSNLLSELHTSHIGFFHADARRASSRAALSATYIEEETSHGKRWILQDVHSGGGAANAGIQPGNILIAVNGREILPPEHPVFPMGRQTKVDFVDNQENRQSATVDVARPKGKKLHFIEPTLVEARRLSVGLGYLKVAMFPGMVGVVVANQISAAVEGLGDVGRLIIDLRGNTGGGIGALRVMSLLTPDKIPVGFALDRRRVNANLDQDKQRFTRFSSIPSSTKGLWPLALQFGPAMLAKRPVVLETEGLGRQPFHGNVVLLVNRPYSERSRDDRGVRTRERTVNHHR